MSRTDWFLIDDAGEVINACSSEGIPSTELAESFGGVRWDRNPPLEKLRRYRYWGERP